MAEELQVLQNAGFSQAEQCSLQALRQRHAAGMQGEQWTLAEWQHLLFARWLVQQGRLSQ